MRTGASCVCDAGSASAECNVAEVRYVEAFKTKFEQDLQFCKQHNIYPICNIDGYKPNGHYGFDAGRLDSMMTVMHTNGYNSGNSRITVDNEPMKYMSKEVYADTIDKTYQQVNGRWYVGAGNEEFGLASAKGDMYQFILDNAEFDYLDIHIQSTMIDPATWRVNFNTVRHWLSTSRAWAKTYGKKLSCTEANWSKIKTEDGHKDLMQERELAKQYGCEDFCIVFINGHFNQYNWLSYLYNGNQNSPYWNDLRNKMLGEIEVKGVKDGMIIKTIGYKTNDVKSGYGVELLHELLMYKEYMEDVENMFVYTDATKTAVEKFQGDLEITVDGRIGRQTWRNFIKSVHDSMDRRDFQFDLEVVMSPYNDQGDT